MYKLKKTIVFYIKMRRKEIINQFHSWMNNLNNREKELKREEKENELMYNEDINIKRLNFYSKMGINKPNMYIEFLFDCSY